MTEVPLGWTAPLVLALCGYCRSGPLCRLRLSQRARTVPGSTTPFQDAPCARPEDLGMQSFPLTRCTGRKGRVVTEGRVLSLEQVTVRLPPRRPSCRSLRPRCAFSSVENGFRRTQGSVSGSQPPLSAQVAPHLAVPATSSRGQAQGAEGS